MGMRLEFSPRHDAEPVERLVDGLIFLVEAIELIGREFYAKDDGGPAAAAA